MNRSILALLLVAVTWIAVGAADPQGRTAFSGLKTGQSVGLKEIGSSYEISVLDDVPQSHKVVEIGEDFVVLEDIAKVTQTTIPVYSVKAVVHLKAR